MAYRLLLLFTLVLCSSVFAQTPRSMREVRSDYQAGRIQLGTVVTLAGRVTVANEFAGPTYFQDSTGGFAIFDNAVHTGVQIGDSIVVTGPLSEFQPTTGQRGTGLLQISGTGTSFRVVQTPRVIPEPRVVTPAQVTEELEGVLVQLNNVEFRTLTGTTFTQFQGNTNYRILVGGNNTGLELRIDGDTELAGAQAPTGPVNLIGVVSEFRGTRQILPRFRRDVGAQAIVIPGENIPLENTLEVCTWNIEWFGDTQNGPTNELLQLQNVATVVQRINADLYAFQEISSDAAFRALVDTLNRRGFVCRGFRAPQGQTQRLGFLWRPSVIDSIGLQFIEVGSWAPFQNVSRYPVELTVDARIRGVSRRLRVVNIHADAGSTLSDYNRRVSDSQALKDWLDRHRPTDNLILLGDYNDDVDVSITPGQPSPYANFVNDAANYRVVTASLSARGVRSTTGFTEMIDHITITNELYPVYFNGTERVENTVYIPNYASTTSDHFPVWTRFALDPTASTEVEASQRPREVKLWQNYPNPFNPTTVITYQVPSSSLVSLTVYDVLGREVATLVNERRSAGTYQVLFNGTNLPSGIYFYRLQAGTWSETKKMMLIK